jgi:hypothetical protein
VAVVAFCALSIAIFYLLFHNRWVHRVVWATCHWRYFGVLSIALVVAARLLLYPRVDGLGIGATGDDAVVLPGMAFVNGVWFYDVSLHGGAPISPGLGWLVLNLPFANPYIHFLLTPAYLTLFSWFCLNSFRDRAQLHLALILMMSTSTFWTLTCSGHDLVAVGLSVAMCYCLAEAALARTRLLIPLALVIGTLCTSRIILVYVPLLLALLHIRHRFRRAVLFGCLSGATAVAWHVSGYWISDWYQPFHLVSRGEVNVGLVFMLVGVLVLLGIAYAAIRSAPNRVRSRFLFASGVAVPLVLFAFGELRAFAYDLAEWEGAGYLFVATPTVVLAVTDTWLRPSNT